MWANMSSRMFLQDALGDDDHQPVVEAAGRRCRPHKCRPYAPAARSRPEKSGSGLADHGGDVVVDQSLHEQGGRARWRWRCPECTTAPKPAAAGSGPAVAASAGRTDGFQALRLRAAAWLPLGLLVIILHRLLSLGFVYLPVNVAGLAAARRGCPWPLIRPPSSTRIWSASSTRGHALGNDDLGGVGQFILEAPCGSARRCAVSTALVESSRISILGFFSRARAMQSRCFWPPDTLVPPCSM